MTLKVIKVLKSEKKYVNSGPCDLDNCLIFVRILYESESVIRISTVRHSYRARTHIPIIKIN